MKQAIIARLSTFKKNTVALGVAVGLAVANNAASAAVSTEEVVTAIVAAGVAIGTVGAAILVMHVGGKVYKWIRSAM